jgi:hypothetical protein
MLSEPNGGSQESHLKEGEGGRTSGPQPLAALCLEFVSTLESPHLFLQAGIAFVTGSSPVSPSIILLLAEYVSSNGSSFPTTRSVLRHHIFRLLA